jgi:hypothetical protein
VNQDDRQKLFETLNQMMGRRMASRAMLANQLKEFSTRLFSAIEVLLAEAQAQGIPGLGKSRRLVHPAGGGREGLQIFIEDWSIIFVPMLGFARPNAADEARIPTAQFKEECARIGVFLTDDPQARAFYDFIILPDGSWFAWGYGWPRQQSDIDSTDFEGLALELIFSFVKDIFVTWDSRGETLLGTALDPKKQAYIYGLPGEERMGG